MKKHLKNTVYISFITLALLFCLEIILGLVIKKRERSRFEERIAYNLESGAYPHKDIGEIKKMFEELYNGIDVQWEPYVHQRIKPYNGKYITIYDDLTRKTTNFYTDTDSVFNIFMFGGSTIWGTGARNDYTIPSHLFKIIDADSTLPQVKITNYGGWGYVRNQESILLQQELLKGNIPDLVVFYDGVNDVVSSTLYETTGLPQNIEHRKQEFNIHIKRDKLFKMVWKSSYIYRTIVALKRRSVSPKQISEDRLNELGQEVVKHYQNNLTITEALSKKYNFKTLNYWQPVVYVRENSSEYDLNYQTQNMFYAPLFKKTYQKIDANQDLNKQKNFRNLSAYLDDGNQYYIDFCHVSEKANELIAKEMYKDIRALLISNTLANEHQ